MSRTRARQVFQEAQEVVEIMGKNTSWRNSHNDVWQEQKKRYYDKNATKASNRYARYTQEETDLILKQEVPDTELCVRLGRTLKAIHIYRSRHHE
jgi:hypothetical protein